MLEICRLIILIPKHVKIDALKTYIYACKQVYNIHFFQHRLQKSDLDMYRRYELQELISKHVKHNIKEPRWS